MGFKPWWRDLHAICVDFKVVSLKTHANPSKSSNQILETYSKSNSRNIHKSIHRISHRSNPRSNHRRTSKQILVFAWVLSVGGVTCMLFVLGFKVVPLKTHTDTSNSLLEPLKTHAFHS